MSEQGFEEVTLKLPQGLYNFYVGLAKCDEDPTVFDCLVRVLAENAKAIIESDAKETLIKIFNLQNILEADC